MIFGNDIKKIEKLSAKGQTEKILPFLQSAKKETRIAAIKALNGEQGELVCNALVSCLATDDVETRLLVAEAIGKCGVRTAIAALEEALKKETSMTVNSVMKTAISRLRTLPEGVKVL